MSHQLCLQLVALCSDYSRSVLASQRLDEPDLQKLTAIGRVGIWARTFTSIKLYPALVTQLTTLSLVSSWRQQKLQLRTLITYQVRISQVHIRRRNSSRLDPKITAASQRGRVDLDTTHKSCTNTTRTLSLPAS